MTREHNVMHVCFFNMHVLARWQLNLHRRRSISAPNLSDSNPSLKRHTWLTCNPSTPNPHHPHVETGDLRMHKAAGVAALTWTKQHTCPTSSRPCCGTCSSRAPARRWWGLTPGWLWSPPPGPPRPPGELEAAFITLSLSHLWWRRDHLSLPPPLVHANRAHYTAGLHSAKRQGPFTPWWSGSEPRRCISARLKGGNWIDTGPYKGWPILAFKNRTFSFLLIYPSVSSCCLCYCLNAWSSTLRSSKAMTGARELKCIIIIFRVR